jgi:hypothetical protein
VSRWNDLFGPDGPFTDRFRTGRVLVVVGVIGLIGSLIAGIVGWVVVARAQETVAGSVVPVTRVVANISETIEASQVIVERTTETIESIENATRSTVRTLRSVGEVLGETASLAEGEVVDSLESAVDTLPGLISTGRIIDRTMRALSFVGVDYDPDLPLDVALAELQSSLAPLPDQVRRQVELLAEVQSDIDEIADDARELTGVLFETRLDMLDTEKVLASAARNAAAAADSAATIETEVERLGALGRVLVLAVTLALLAASLTPLVVGLYLSRTSGQRSDQAAT